MSRAPASPHTPPESARPKAVEERAPAPRLFWLLPAGASIAFVGALCGIGGGLFAVPLLHFVQRLEFRRAVATSLALVLATATTATAAEALRGDSALDLRLIAYLVVGALAGSRVGFAVARRLDVRVVRALFVLAVAFAGLRILVAGDSAPDAGAPEVEGLALAAIAIAIGFCGGFVSPLLGIGGGLVFVPALYLVLPALGFATARAVSLAASIAPVAHSVHLYARAREIDRPSAVWLAAGAVLGALAGVWTVHLPEFVDVARKLLGIVLLYVAARFAMQLARERKPAGS